MSVVSRTPGPPGPCFSQIMCRLCAKDEKFCVQIFGDEGRRQQLEMKIRKCLPIIVREEDNLPKQVCLTCLSKLDVSYDLFDTSLQAEFKMNQIMEAARKKNMVDTERKRPSTASMVTIPSFEATPPPPKPPSQHPPPQVLPQSLPVKKEPQDIVELTDEPSYDTAKRARLDQTYANNEQFPVHQRNVETFYKPVSQPLRTYGKMNSQRMPNVATSQQQSFTNSSPVDRNHTAQNFHVNNNMSQDRQMMQTQPPSNLGRGRVSAMEHSSVPPNSNSAMVNHESNPQPVLQASSMMQRTVSYQHREPQLDRRREQQPQPQQQQQQVQQQTPDQSSTCGYCGKSFPEDIVDHHRALHLRETFYSCLDCGKNFRTQVGLETHRNCTGSTTSRNART